MTRHHYNHTNNQQAAQTDILGSTMQAQAGERDPGQV